MAKRKFEFYFEGNHNAVLRERIREQSRSFYDGETVHQTIYDAITALADTVAFDALGQARLEATARDYQEIYESRIGKG